MRAEGWLTDVALRGDEAILWVRDSSGGRIRLTDRYHPDFYAEPRGVEPWELKSLLEEHPKIRGITIETRVSSISRDGEKTVARVRVGRVEDFRQVSDQVEALPLVARVYDVDLPHELRYLSERGLTPMGNVEVDADEEGNITSIRSLEADLEPEPPPIRTLIFEAELDEEHGSVTTMNHLMRAEYTFEGNLITVLHDFVDYFADVDPDVVCSSRGDLERLVSLCRLHGVRSSGQESGGGPILWEGRAHLTPHTYRRLGIAGLVERVQFTKAPPRLSADWAAGKCIDNRQCYDARRRGILVPRADDYQPVTTLAELSDTDKGALILAPTVGVHENVALLDFESMFPNLIVRRNISYETTGRSDAPEGFIADFTRDALGRRLHFKRLHRNLQRGSERWLWCEERQTALKEMLVVIYGYSGCFANRFGSMDAYMEINRQARDGLVAAMNVARSHGYSSLYGNNDSLFVTRPDASPTDYEALAAEIAGAVGLPMAVDNVFRLLVLLPKKAEAEIGALNRYYGVTLAGDVVCRGIELRRHNTPPYVAEAQMRVIEAILGCASAEEAATVGVQRAHDAVEEACAGLAEGSVPQEKLRVSTILRRSPAAYSTRPGHVTAAEALAMNGTRVEEDAVVDYLYVDAGSHNPFRRVKPAAYAGGRVDLGKYVDLVREAAESVLAPFEGPG